MAKPNKPTRTQRSNPPGTPAATFSATTPSQPAVPSKPRDMPPARVELKPHAAHPSPQAIAEAAYFLWLKRGGNATVNWLEAEARLKATLVR